MPKSKHQIPGRVRSTYEFIKAHRDRHSVEAMCRTLEVAPSGSPQQEFASLLNHVRKQVEASSR